MDNKCLIKNVIYKATISSAKETKNYKVSTGNNLKVDGTIITTASKIIKKTGPS